MEVLYHIRPYFDIFCRAHSPYIALRPPVSSTYLGVRDRSLSPGLKLQSRETQILFTSREFFSIPKKGIDQYPTKISSIIHYLGLNPLFIYMVSDIYDIIIISSTIFIYGEWLFWSYLIHKKVQWPRSGRDDQFPKTQLWYLGRAGVSNDFSAGKLET